VKSGTDLWKDFTDVSSAVTPNEVPCGAKPEREFRWINSTADNRWVWNGNDTQRLGCVTLWQLRHIPDCAAWWYVGWCIKSWEDPSLSLRPLQEKGRLDGRPL